MGSFVRPLVAALAGLSLLLPLPLREPQASLSGWTRPKAFRCEALAASAFSDRTPLSRVARVWVAATLIALLPALNGQTIPSAVIPSNPTQSFTFQVAPAVSETAVRHHLAELTRFPLRQVGSPGFAMTVEYVTRSLQSYGYTGTRLKTLSLAPDLPISMMALPLKPRPGVPTVLVVSHADSTGAAGSRESQGADDNASGVSATLELARLFANEDHSKANIVFLFTFDEENNRLGASAGLQALVQSQKLPLDTIQVLNIDSIGQSHRRLPRVTLRAVTRAGQNAGSLLQTLAAHPLLHGVSCVVDPRGTVAPGSEGSTDGASLTARASRGVPTVEVSSRLPDEPTVWHTERDERTLLNVDAIVATTDWLARGLRQFAGAASFFSRSPRAFKPIIVPTPPPAADEHPAMESLFKEFGLEFISPTPRHISADNVRVMRRWLTDLRERWPNFSNHVKGMIYVPGVPLGAAVRQGRPRYLLYWYPLELPVVSDGFNSLDPETNTDLIDRETMLLTQLFNWQGIPSYRKQGVFAIPKEPAYPNELAILTTDAASWVYRGRLSDRRFLPFIAPTPAAPRPGPRPVLTLGAEAERERLLSDLLKEKFGLRRPTKPPLPTIPWKDLLMPATPAAIPSAPAPRPVGAAA